MAAAAALVCAGCGTYSTEDLRFLGALPHSEDLRVDVPEQANGNAATVCATRSADMWLWAKPTSDRLNAGVAFVVGLVDLVRRHPPTWRDDDQRRWGPFDADEHPGREIQILMWRTYPSELGGAPQYDYEFQARWKGTPDFTTVIEGSFEGHSASRGNGTVTLYFQSLWDLQMNEADAPHGTMLIEYERAAEPATIVLDLGQQGFGVASFRYEYAGYADRRGTFRYRFQNAAGEVAQVTSSFDAAGAGRAAVEFWSTRGNGSFQQCWDSTACLVYVDDPLNLSCGAAPCSFGLPTDCPQDAPPMPL